MALDAGVTARIMGVGLNTILRHLKNSGRSR
ncbi:IS1-like element transposase [Escherichia coli]